MQCRFANAVRPSESFRAVTSLGWRPHADQIGQTGIRIAPEIYIACGVSGATQHLVGCQGAKRILAINTDPEATIIAKSIEVKICFWSLASTDMQRING